MDDAALSEMYQNLSIDQLIEALERKGQTALALIKLACAPARIARAAGRGVAEAIDDGGMIPTTCAGIAWSISGVC